jgi:hypothetical protein
MDAEDRMVFVRAFFAIIRCLADGNAPIGFSRRDDVKGKTHRKSDGDVDQEVVRTPQQVLEPNKESEWREASASRYAE